MRLLRHADVVANLLQRPELLPGAQGLPQSWGLSFAGGAIACHLIDDQVRQLVGAIELGPRWLEEVLAIISLKDEVNLVKDQRGAVIEKQRRMGKAYVDGLFPDGEYQGKETVGNGTGIAGGTGRQRR